jgi:hypothetical protein
MKLTSFAMSCSFQCSRKRGSRSFTTYSELMTTYSKLTTTSYAVFHQFVQGIATKSSSKILLQLEKDTKEKGTSSSSQVSRAEIAL